MRVNFKVSHDLRIVKTITGASLFFKQDVGNYKYKDIKVEIEPYEIRSLIKELVEYLSKIEQERIEEIQNLRRAFRYSNCKVLITYTSHD